MRRYFGCMQTSGKASAIIPTGDGLKTVAETRATESRLELGEME